MESQGDPKMVPKSSQGLPEEAPGGAPEASRKGCRKSNDFQTPWDSENEAAVEAAAQFSLSEGTPKRLPKWSRNGARIAPRSARRRSEVAPGALLKNSAKMTPKSKPHGVQNRPQKGVKIC